ncbi:hypothetical protein GJ697_00835 [Pseudoduganella sp. FT25W]|uniref:Uncharacterized protein n=1 Tax=Duganella alba TaxID=2666081 RepID=A0A6L5Q975_9BURK|nr:hypothetical protein [Duganella alba]MRX06374.1 hypothetical protein [Duganella alba]MRX14768.1 hypothetical protein [Duganella alba]
MRRHVVAALLAGVCHAASADEAELRKAEQALQQARATNSNELSRHLQMLAAQRAFMGDANGAIAAFDEQPGRTPSADADDVERLTAAKEEDAIEAIVREAGKHQIVILNEAHHVPLHRAFAMRLARELHRSGYTWLACETFQTAPFKQGYLAAADGYYSGEPVFGNFLREAAASGWQMVQYEPLDDTQAGTFEERIERRESGEARNLVKRIFAGHPDAKVFIYVGYSHAMEVPRFGDKGNVWMAAQLRHLTGLDPLTIDQTDMMAHSVPTAEHPVYAAAVNRAQRTSPFVLRAPGGGYEVFGHYRNAMDMQVVHPRYGDDAASGRPAWLRTLAGFEAVDVPAATQSAPHFVYAYPAGQPDHAVPADVVRIEPDKPTPKFMLPQGDYRFVERP